MREHKEGTEDEDVGFLFRRVCLYLLDPRGEDECIYRHCPVRWPAYPTGCDSIPLFLKGGQTPASVRPGGAETVPHLRRRQGRPARGRGAERFPVRVVQPAPLGRRP